ncbi:hypothetical protein QYM36_019257 [Artemia franciscana]|uniref:MULE transposase domain-containing protein n=1 Tax=Artemia franciscana TaxID=6661 RepID=A0AA88HB07_ARTSF|nr:hypothetical protein QYM36_019257 [Artemia franciscana]
MFVKHELATRIITDFDNLYEEMLFEFILYWNASCMPYPYSRHRHTASLIDNLFTNLDLKTCDVIIYDDSDHFLILSEVTLDKPKVEHPERKTRKLDAESIESLRNQLNNINRSPCLDNQDVDQAANYFIQEFVKAFDRACPAKTSKSRRQEPRKPWISKGIVQSIKIKNQLYKIRIENPSEDNKEKFRLYKNNLTIVIRAAKASHYTKLFAEASGSHKKSWEIIHGIIGKKKKMSKFPESINHGPELVSDRPGIANVFNKHFANVGVRTVKESVAANNSEQRNKFEDYLPPSSLSSLFLKLTSKEELINIVNLLKPGGAEGIDADPHEELFMVLMKKAPSINSPQNAFLSDREKGIEAARNKIFPLTQPAHCWLHFRINAKHALQEMGAPKGDIKIPDFNTVSGITNNTAESFNAVMKRVIQQQRDVPMDRCILGLLCLDDEYYTHVSRGYKEIGDYRLLEKAHKEYIVHIKKKEDSVESRKEIFLRMVQEVDGSDSFCEKNTTKEDHQPSGIVDMAEAL